MNFKATFNFSTMFVFTKFKCLSLAFCVILLSPLTTIFASRAAKQRTVVRILCFGDSLTFGMTKGPPHPYTTKLQEYFNLRDQMPEKRLWPGSPTKFRQVELYNAGLSGEKVRNGMIPRLGRILQGTKYDWVIILGGTNDLFGMRSVWVESNKVQDELSIFNAIVQLHGVAHKSGAKTVAMTIPALQCEVKRRIGVIMEVRLKVNEMIRNFVKNSEGKVLLADLDKKIKLPRHQFLCGDGIHLTAPAYDRMAEIIFNSIKEFV